MVSHSLHHGIGGSPLLQQLLPPVAVEHPLIITLLCPQSMALCQHSIRIILVMEKSLLPIRCLLVFALQCPAWSVLSRCKRLSMSSSPTSLPIGWPASKPSWSVAAVSRAPPSSPSPCRTPLCSSCEKILVSPRGALHAAIDG